MGKLQNELVYILPADEALTALCQRMAFLGGPLLELLLAQNLRPEKAEFPMSPAQQQSDEDDLPQTIASESYCVAWLPGEGQDPMKMN